MSTGCGLHVTDSGFPLLHVSSDFLTILIIVKRILIGSAAVVSLLSATSAFAAGLPARVYTKVPVMAVVYDWTGFYIGGNVGYGWGRAGTDGNISGTQSSANSARLDQLCLRVFPLPPLLDPCP
jgi:hypothetical protein